MTLPVPTPGLVIRYAYLWGREADAGLEEGLKDRPCAVVIAHRDREGELQVYVLPVTHAEPGRDQAAIEIPRLVKQRLRLDGERSWVVVDEANLFAWPGPDIRPVPGDSKQGFAYGFLPPGFFRLVRDRFLALARSGKASATRRSE
ncbi:hypothetical protein D3874_26900 [Oleomonas cavernae]|uniref:Growth inhibitor PemK n=1 Tax=Oleomonas cavernae TaxID=2320859 RepID=A0A418VUA1_9PROT|nr:hypothetical protein [Oleomonas cavernae]RJF80720.1 hypothetical protein D3874_26900 [Oleomonas cavernae]